MASRKPTFPFAMVERVQQIAREKGVTPGQIALAWLLHKGEDIVPIPGTKRIHYLEENIAATNIALSAAEIARIEEVVGKPVGARYAEAMMRLIANAEEIIRVSRHLPCLRI